MAKLPFTKLKLKVDTGVKEVVFQGENEEYVIEVLNYLPVLSKIELVTDSVNEAALNGIIRKDLLDVYFHLNIVLKYTNLSFTPTALLKNAELYDILLNQGIIDLVVDTMEAEEYEGLLEYTQVYAEQFQKLSDNSIVGYTAQVKAIEDTVESVLGKDFREKILENELEKTNSQ